MCNLLSLPLCGLYAQGPCGSYSHHKMVKTIPVSHRAISGKLGLAARLLVKPPCQAIPRHSSCSIPLGYQPRFTYRLFVGVEGRATPPAPPNFERAVSPAHRSKNQNFQAHRLAWVDWPYGHSWKSLMNRPHFCGISIFLHFFGFGGLFDLYFFRGP